MVDYIETTINGIVYRRKKFLPKEAFLIISEWGFYGANHEISKLSELKLNCLSKCVAIEPNGKETALNNPFLFDEHFAKYPNNLFAATQWVLDGGEDIKCFLGGLTKENQEGQQKPTEQ